MSRRFKGGAVPPLGYLPLVLAAGLMGLNLNRPLADPDVFWHLQAGHWMLDHGQIATSDPFSFSMLNQPWTAHEWLFEVILATIDHWGGYTGMVLLGHLLFLLFIFLLHRWLARLAPQTALLTRSCLILAVTITLFPFWVLRPQLVSYLCFIALLLLLEAAVPSRRHVAFLALLTFLWVNSHGSFILAPALVGLKALTTWRQTRQWAGVFLLVVLAGMINPWGPAHYWYPWQIAGDKVMLAAINEWHSPNFHLPYARYLLSGWLVAFFAVLTIRGRSVPLDRLLLTTGFLLLTLTAVRYTPYWIIGLTGLLLAGPAGENISFRRPAAPSRRHPLINGIFWLGFTGFYLWTFYFLPQGPLARHLNPDLPVEAADVWAQMPAGSRLLNDYNWGGFLIWYLPEHPVFIDGRADLYAGKVFNQYLQLQNLRDYQAVLEEWQFAGVLLPPEKSLTQILLLKPDKWQVLYADEKAVLLIPCPQLKE
ncbi:MAG: hypothetical protein PHC60_07925 [Heliobacteriaceae bacterium]|nr:hypothetical protein [Heliobacteriaceae bacterium]MDD4588299.1 hypothetical protein [Heliobacteriaceae bacterium]